MFLNILVLNEIFFYDLKILFTEKTRVSIDFIHIMIFSNVIFLENTNLTYPMAYGLVKCSDGNHFYSIKIIDNFSEISREELAVRL